MDLSAEADLSILGITEAVGCRVIEYSLDCKYYDWYVVSKENHINGYVAKYFFKVYTEKYYNIGVAEINALKKNADQHYNCLLSSYIKSAQNSNRVEILMRYDGEPLSYWIKNHKISQANYAKIGIQIMREISHQLFTLNAAHLNINLDTIMLKLCTEPHINIEVHFSYFTSLTYADSPNLSYFVLDTKYLAPEIASYLPEYRPLIVNEYKSCEQHSPSIERPLSTIVNNVLPNLEIKDKTKIDIFALALVIYNMGCNKPLKGIDKISKFQDNPNCMLNQKGNLYNQILKNLVYLMLQDEQHLRPTFKQILNSLPNVYFQTFATDPPIEIGHSKSAQYVKTIIRTCQAFHTIISSDDSVKLLANEALSTSLPDSVVLPSVSGYYIPEKYISLYDKYKSKATIEFADIKEILSIMKAVASNLDITKSFHGSISPHRIYIGEVIKYIYGQESKSIGTFKSDESKIKGGTSSKSLVDYQKDEEEKGKKSVNFDYQINVQLEGLDLSYAPPELHEKFLEGINKASVDGPKVDIYMLGLVMLSVLALKLEPDEMLDYFYGPFPQTFPISCESTNQWIKSSEIVKHPESLLEKIKSIKYSCNEILRPYINNFFAEVLEPDPIKRMDLGSAEKRINEIFSVDDSNLVVENSQMKEESIANANIKTPSQVYTDEIEHNKLAFSCGKNSNIIPQIWIPEYKPLITRALENKAISSSTIIRKYTREVINAMPAMKCKSKYTYNNIPCLAQIININQENYFTFFVIGGCIAAKAVDSVYKQSHCDSSKLVQIQSMREKRMLFGATSFSEYIYVAGGRSDYYNQFTNSNTIEYYDLKDDQWRSFHQCMKQRLVNPALVVSTDFRLYVAFGNSGMCECEEENSIVDRNSTLIQIFDCIAKKVDRVININKSNFLAVSYIGAVLAEIDDANLLLFGGKPIYKIEKETIENMPAQLIQVDKIESSAYIMGACNRKIDQYVDYSFKCNAVVNATNEIIFMPLLNQSSRVAVYDKEKSTMSYWPMLNEENESISQSHNDKALNISKDI